jgi:phosphatidylglycerophosphatase A
VRTLVVVLATAGGVGYAPLAPGTCGSLIAVPFLPLLAGLRTRSLPVYAAATLLLVAVAVWAAGRAADLFGGHDDSRIVIDEVAGLVIAGLFVPGTWLATGLAFAFFRLFDVLKPFPAGWVDRRVRGGLGVVGDDLVAGVYAGLCARLALGLL